MLVKEYEEKIAYLQNQNMQLQESLLSTQKADNFSVMNSAQFISKSEHQSIVAEIIQKHENNLKMMSEIHNQEKSLLIDRLEWKQTFTFGEKSKKDGSEVYSNSTIRDEIDKLTFMLEEKEYMNIELKDEIIQLRERLAQSNDHDDCNKEIDGLIKENNRLQNDLNQTEENYNEQWLLYKQKLNDERKRNKEIKEEMKEMKTTFEKRISAIIEQIKEKDEEIEKLRTDGRTSVVDSEDHGMDSVIIHESSRVYDQNSMGFYRDRRTRSSVNFQNEDIANAREDADKYLIENANRIEWRKWLNLLNPTSFYGHFKYDGTCAMQNQNKFESPVIRRSISPNCRSVLALNSQDFSLHYPQSIDYSASTIK